VPAAASPSPASCRVAFEATRPRSQWRNRAGLAPDFPVMPGMGTQGKGILPCHGPLHRHLFSLSGPMPPLVRDRRTPLSRDPWRALESCGPLGHFRDSREVKCALPLVSVTRSLAARFPMLDLFECRPDGRAPSRTWATKAWSAPASIRAPTVMSRVIPENASRC